MSGFHGMFQRWCHLWRGVCDTVDQLRCAPLIATLCVMGSVIIAILWVSPYLITKSDAEPFRPPSGIVACLLAGIAF